MIGCLLFVFMPAFCKWFRLFIVEHGFISIKCAEFSMRHKLQVDGPFLYRLGLFMTNYLIQNLVVLSFTSYMYFGSTESCKYLQY